MFGRLGGLGGRDTEGKDSREEERRKIIRRGQAARERARALERGIPEEVDLGSEDTGSEDSEDWDSLDESGEDHMLIDDREVDTAVIDTETCMKKAATSGGAATPEASTSAQAGKSRITTIGTQARETRRTSIGRAAKVDAKTTPPNRAAERKLSIDGDPSKKGRGMPNSAGGESGETPKEQTTAEMFLEMKKMMMGINSQIGEVRVDIGDVKNELGQRIDAGSRATEELKIRMDDNDRNFDTRVAAVITKVTGSQGLGSQGNDASPGNATPTSSGPSGAYPSYASCLAGPSIPFTSSFTNPKEAKYWACRKSLRMWPVAGQEMKKAVGIFLKQKLKLENSFLASMGELSVATVPFTSRSKIKEEVIVSFASIEVRDIVRHAARELGGDPASGIRLEIPQFL